MGAESVSDYGVGAESVSGSSATGAMPRAARRFSSGLDEYARHLPFHVGVEVVGSVKRYVRR